MNISYRKESANPEAVNRADSSAADKQAWLSFLAGDNRGLELIYDKYFSLLFNYSGQFTRNRDLVKDSIQELFVELMQKRETLPPVTYLKSYLFQCIRRKLLHVQQKERKLPLLYDIPEDYAFRIEHSPEILLLREQMDTEILNALRKSYAKLSTRQKEALYLKFYENLSYDEIAEVMEFKEVKYARTLVYRALAELRTELSVALPVSTAAISLLLLLAVYQI